MRVALAIAAVALSACNSANDTCASPCASGTTCVNGGCYVTCNDSSTCSPSEICFSGVCTAAPTAPADVLLPIPGIIDLDFTTGRLPSGVTMSRTTPAITQDTNGISSVSADTPRFDIDTKFLGPRGLLIEPASENYCIDSEIIVGRWWLARAQDSAATVNAPNGEATATRVSPDGTTVDAHSTGIDVPVSDTGKYTYSLFLKAGELGSIDMGVAANEYPQQVFDLTTGALGTQFNRNIITDAGIAYVGDGWYRGWIVVDASTLGSTISILVELGEMPPDLSKGAYIWGCQVEHGTSPTSYIATADQTVSRDADDVRLATPSTIDLGQDFTALVLLSTPTDDATDAAALSIIAGTTELTLGRLNGGNTGLTISQAAYTNLDISVGARWLPNAIHAIAITHHGYDFALADEGQITHGSDGNWPAPGTPPDTVRIGQRVSTPSSATHVRRVVFWQQLFDDTTLANMTRP